jgi:hypothetical protein
LDLKAPDAQQPGASRLVVASTALLLLLLLLLLLGGRLLLLLLLLLRMLLLLLLNWKYRGGGGKGWRSPAVGAGQGPIVGRAKPSSRYCAAKLLYSRRREHCAFVWPL